MTTIYITSNTEKEILSINQSIEGAARFVYGMGAAKIGDEICNYKAIVDALEKAAQITIVCSDEQCLQIERHFVAA